MKKTRLDLGPVRNLARRRIKSDEERNGKLLSTTEVGQLLSLSTQKIIKMFDSGHMRGKRIGNRRRIPMGEVERLQQEWEVHRGLMEPSEALSVLQLKNYTDLYRLCAQRLLTCVFLGSRERRYHEDSVEELRRKWGIEPGTHVLDISTAAQLLQCHYSNVCRAVQPNAQQSYIECLEEQKPPLRSKHGRPQHRINDYIVWQAMLATEGAPSPKIVRLSRSRQETFSVPPKHRIILPARGSKDLAKYLDQCHRSIVMIAMDPGSYDDEEHAQVKNAVEKVFRKWGFPAPSVPTLDEMAAIESGDLYPPDLPEEQKPVRSRARKSGSDAKRKRVK